MNNEKIENIIKKDEYLLLKSNIEIAINESKGIIIFEESDVDKAGFYIKKFKGLDKKIENVRKEIVTPINNEVKEINNLFKGLSALYTPELDRLNKESNEILKEIRTRQEAIRIAEQKELQESVLDEAILFEDETILESIPTIEYKQQKVQSDNLTTMRTKKWRIIDFDIIPRNYLVVNETLLNELRKTCDFDAKSPIEGIEYFYDETVRVK